VEKTTYRIYFYIHFLASVIGILLLFQGPFAADSIGIADIPYLLLIVLHLIQGIVFFIRSSDRPVGIDTGARKYAQFLFFISLVMFLFAFIFAKNANMDYVQRFIASGGNLRLAPDSGIEQLSAVARYIPFLAVNLALYLDPRFRNSEGNIFSDWALFWVLGSAFLTTIAFPSFLSLRGIGWLGWVCLIPLILVLKSVSLRRGIFYGVLFGILATILMNYWLGTFSLVSLQVIIVIFLIFYLLFMSGMLFFLKKTFSNSFLLLPFIWVLFDFLRSNGFLGYPWGHLGATQYNILPFIQLSSLTGIWGLSFILLFCNACASEFIYSRIFEGRSRTRLLGLAVLLILGVFLFGFISISIDNPEPITETVRIALIQHNADSRKHNYEDTFEDLKSLTLDSLSYKPDIVIWSETAFVPNIRRWSREDPAKYRLARLVKEFITFQNEIGTWLLTGNDDYVFVRDSDGEEERVDYNAAVLFDASGNISEIYHKNHLVPFTEYFPYQHIFPRVHNFLENFDVNFWEPGDEKTVFEHPKFSFSTPICFEDVFPAEVRDFVLNGSDIIINISNDYWSLTEVEAKQHFIHSKFRAVENRVPLLRATSSGLTCYVNEKGALISFLPYYEKGVLLCDVPIRNNVKTLYTLLGDWFPLFSVLVLLAAVAVIMINRKKRIEP
jgi:apolipoprotein N-acyltransferase